MENNKREVNLVGKTFGSLKVESKFRDNSKWGSLWHCKCKCGNELNVSTATLMSGSKASCGCKRKVKDMTDIVGKTFGKLEVVGIAERTNRLVKYLCECECGNTCTVIRGNLLSGHTKSCGCYVGGRGRKKGSTNKTSKKGSSKSVVKVDTPVVDLQETTSTQDMGTADLRKDVVQNDTNLVNKVEDLVNVEASVTDKCTTALGHTESFATSKTGNYKDKVLGIFKGIVKKVRVF